MSSMCCGGVREQLADLDAALAVLLELERRGERGAGLALGRQVRHRQGLAGVFVQRRLGVERIDVGGPAVHEQVDDALGLRRKMRQPRRQRILVAGVADSPAGRRAAAPPSASTPARPSMPKPMPERRRSSRRVSEQCDSARSIDIHHLVRQQQQLGVLLPGGKLHARPAGAGAAATNCWPMASSSAVGRPVQDQRDRGRRFSRRRRRQLATSGRAARAWACSTTKGEFIRNRACCGTVVRGRRGLL